MKFSTVMRWDSSALGVLALAGVVVLFSAPPAMAGQFLYAPIPPGDIISATFSADFAALVAHRTVGGYEMNYTRLHDPSGGLPPLDLSDSLFGTAAYPDVPVVNMGVLETGWVSAAIAPTFFPALEGGQIGIEFLFTDTDDALFAIDTLILTIETPTKTIVDSYYGAPVGNENNGFGIGLADGGNLPGAFPGVLTPTGTGFDEEISSKTPEPTSLLLLGLGWFALPRRRRRGLCAAGGQPVRSRASVSRTMLAVPALLACGLMAAPAVADVLPGIDAFTTPAGSWTAEFCGGCPACPNPPCTGIPLPADFFGPGSDPFGGVIFLQGDPFPGQGFGTIIERTTSAPLSGCPAVATVDIEIVALSLVSSQPITVTYNGGQNPEQWDVRVCLSDLPQSPGSMNINQDCPAGGTFDSTLMVLPKFTFTPTAGGPPTLIFDAGVEGYPPLAFSAIGAVWTDQAPAGFPDMSIPPGLVVDGNCDGLDDAPLPVGTSNFVAGVSPGVDPGDPCVCGAPPGPCREIKLTEEQSDNDRHAAVPLNVDASCCKKDGTCVPIADANGVVACIDAGDVPLGGDGASCDVLGACCFPIVTPESDCVTTTKCCCEDVRSGIWQGPDTACTLPEACCLPDGPCVVVDPLCCDELGGWLPGEPDCLGDGNGNGIDDVCEPDQLHLYGPTPNQIQVGRGVGTIVAAVQANFVPVPGRDVIFTKLLGSFTFTSGTVSPDGTQATVTTDVNGAAVMTFTADGPGTGLIQATATGAGLSAYSFFEIVAGPEPVGGGHGKKGVFDTSPQHGGPSDGGAGAGGS